MKALLEAKAILSHRMRMITSESGTAEHQVPKHPQETKCLLPICSLPCSHPINLMTRKCAARLIGRGPIAGPAIQSIRHSPKDGFNCTLEGDLLSGAGFEPIHPMDINKKCGSIS